MSVSELPEVRVDGERLLGELDDLSRISDAPHPAVTRVLFTPTELVAREFVRGIVTRAGLALRDDPAGNLFARWQGTEPDLPAVTTGSHIDAIPFAGRFDGTVGALGGIEALRALREAGFRPRRSLEAIVFTSEEPTRFGVGCLGSRALSGAIEPERLAELTDADGETFDRARQAAGCSGALADARLPRDAYRCFLELHIEQGPILEQERQAVGVVTAIAAPSTLRITVRGDGGHAGAVLMAERRDALTAAAEIVLGVERVARASEGADGVATTGILEVHPGASNSIPSRVRLTVDARHIDRDARDALVREIRSQARSVASRRQVTVRIETLHSDDPTACGPEVVQAVERAAAELGLSCRRMVSRAYHDASFMARVCPVGMIFVPSAGGHSHRPEEFTSSEDIVNGVRVLAGALARLASD